MIGKTKENPLLDRPAGPMGFNVFCERFRQDFLRQGETSSHKEEMDKCASDPVYWINTYCKTYDPRPGEGNRSMSFKLWPKQALFIQWLQEREKNIEGGVCEKSRDAGVSFMCAAYALHGWLFRPGYKVGFGSRKMQFVDRLGDMDSILEKIRFMLRHLPDDMKPKGFKHGEHDCHTKILNPENGASITGEGGDDIGRGGRCSIYFLDEAAHVEHPELVNAALSATTDVRIDVSTPNGSGNPFAMKRNSGIFPVFTFHWKEDPRKNRYEIQAKDGSVFSSGNGSPTEIPSDHRVVYPWKEKKTLEIGATAFAAEYDIDYSASMAGITIPGAWVRAAIELPLPKSARCVAGLDIGEEGDDLSVFIPRWGPVVGMPQSWGKSNTTQTAWKAAGLATTYGAAELDYDSVGVGAGVKGTFNSAEIPLTFKARPINVGDAPTENIWPDGQTSKEKFFNFKAELWWLLRQRFERTYEYVTQGIKHPPEDLISIPNCPQLISELSIPLHEYTDKGRIRIESKQALARRGVKSPDHAEALVLSEAAFATPIRDFMVW